MNAKSVVVLTLICALILPVMLYANAADDALAMIKKRQFNQAIELLEKSVDKDPSNADLYYLLGRAYYAKGNFDQAEVELEKCLDRKRKHEDARYYLALVYIKKQEWDKAKEILDEGAEKSKDNKGLFENGLGLYHLARGEYNDADLAFRLALIEDPGNLEYQRNMADLAFEQKIYAVAEQGYKKILEQDSTDAEAWFRLGRSQFNQRMFPDALQSLSKAIGLDSNYVEAYKLDGDIYMLAGQTAQNNGQTQEAQEHFSNAAWMYQHFLDLGGEETPELDYHLGQAYFSLNVYAEAIDKLKKAIDLGIDKSQAYDLLAKSYFRLKEYDNAFGAYHQYEMKVTGGDPNYQWTAADFEFFKERAQTLFQLYNETKQGGEADSSYLEMAVKDYEKAIQLKPEDPIVPQLYVQLALSYYYLGKYQEAIPWFEKKIAIDPDVYNTYLNLAYCYLKLGDNEKAIAEMTKVTELNPSYCLAYKTIANSYLVSIKDIPKAETWYQKWADCDSANYEPYKWLGYIAISAKPPRKDAAVSRLLIAVRKMDAAKIDYCQDPDVIIWLAQAYNMYDDIDKEEEALKWAKRAIKCKPDNKDLKQIIEDLE